MSGVALCLTGAQHQALQTHLFPGDGLEAAAILLCRRAELTRARLIVHTIILVPHNECRRTSATLTWLGEQIENAIDVAEKDGLSLILTHSHPGGLFAFSQTDDESDAIVVPNIFAGWTGSTPVSTHGSSIMTPDGRMLARVYDCHHGRVMIDHVAVVGDDVSYHFPDDQAPGMAFGTAQTRLFSRLHAAIIGVSGTGSVIAEQAARLGFGRITLVDFDRIEPKNLNRILNSTSAHATQGALKVEAIATALRTIYPNLIVNEVAASIASREAILAAANCDVIFSCVDSAEGRQIADLLSQAFVLPLIDMGVTIPTRRTSEGLAIADVLGRIDYVKPGGATLFDRGVFDAAALRAEYLAKTAPQEFEREKAAGYIRGAPDEAPSVIALNMRAASAAMLEWISRTFPFRHAPNSSFARTMFSMAEPGEEYFGEETWVKAVGTQPRGTTEPLLGIPAFGLRNL